MGLVRIRQSSHDFEWQSSHSVDLAGWQAKMASIESWIPWRNAHKPHRRSYRWLGVMCLPLNHLTFLPLRNFSSSFREEKERKSAIKGFRFFIDKLLTRVSGLKRSTATPTRPFVQNTKVTLFGIPPCQCPIVKRSGVTYSCSYVLLL